MSRQSQIVRSRWARNRAKATTKRITNRTALGDDANGVGSSFGPGLLIVAPFVAYAAIVVLGSELGSKV